MGRYSLIRPEDDAVTQQASDWATALDKGLGANGHSLDIDVRDITPPDRTNIEAAINGLSDVIFYFGHGDEQSWKTNGQPTLDSTNASQASGKTVVSVACKTGRSLGPDAILAGVDAWLGFNISVAVVRPYKGFDPLGEAIVEALEFLGQGGSVQFARNILEVKLEQVASDHDTGKFKNHPDAPLIYFSALAMQANLVVLGNQKSAPL